MHELFLDKYNFVMYKNISKKTEHERSHELIP
jgi:hypothetical protein